MRKLPSKTLTEKIPYRRTVWVTGFLKTSLSGTLISTGVLFIFNGITNHPWFDGWHEISIILGILELTSAISIIYIIDKWKETKKKEELETINEHIEERAIKIAEEKILEAMENLEK